MAAVVVLTYDAPAGMLERCVGSIVASGDASAVIVVDNGSSARERLRDSPCQVVTTGRNLGFAGGMNVGLRLALGRGEHAVAVINDDVEVEPGWLALLEHELDDPDVGAAQPKLLFAQQRDGRDVVNSLGVTLDGFGAGSDIASGRDDDPCDREACDIEIFTGGAVLLRARMLAEIGLFDARYRFYYEDVDLSLRGRERGWRYRCAPASRVRHHGGVSTARIAATTAYLRERNRLWVLFRHRQLRDISRGVWLSVRRLRHRPRSAHLRGLVAGLAAAPRLVVERRRARP